MLFIIDALHSSAMLRNTQELRMCLVALSIIVAREVSFALGLILCLSPQLVSFSSNTLQQPRLSSLSELMANYIGLM